MYIYTLTIIVCTENWYTFSIYVYHIYFYTYYILYGIYNLRCKYSYIYLGTCIIRNIPIVNDYFNKLIQGTSICFFCCRNGFAMLTLYKLYHVSLLKIKIC
jgi:hypothetical protein